MQNRFAKSLLPAVLLFPLVAVAADPPDGALTESSLELSYSTGPMPIPNVNTDVLGNGAYTCSATNPCDDFELTVDLPEDYLTKYPKAGISVAAAASVEYTDIDLQIADSSGKIIALQRDNPPAQPATSFRVKNGLNVYHVQVVPGTPVPDASVTIKLTPGPAASKSAIEKLGGAMGGALLLPLLGLAALRRRR